MRSRAPRAYYNEIDPYAAQWIRNLVAAGHIMAGDVDTRSILDVRPSDLVGYTRCHFFAGVAVWDYALGLAGWPPEREVWTGSCPCQPFSTAGRRGGTADERHLWPALYHLIEQRRPAAFLGEQVASKDGLDWLDLVQADLEGANYDVGAVDLCAAGVGAPHVRQRLWIVADAQLVECGSGRVYGSGQPRPAVGECAPTKELAGVRGSGFVAEPAVPGPQGRGAAGQRTDAQCASFERGGATILMGDAERQWLRGRRRRADAGAARGVPHSHEQRQRVRHEPRATSRPCFWSDIEWIACRDGKARPTQPGLFPLAHGAPARMGRLRAYGNAINAEAAATFIGAVLDVRPGPRRCASAAPAPTPLPLFEAAPPLARLPLHAAALPCAAEVR